MDLDLGEIEEALTGSPVTAEEIAVAMGLLIVGLGLAFVLGRLFRRLFVMPGDQSEAVLLLVARLGQIVVVTVFSGLALTTLGARFGWVTLLVILSILVGALAIRPLVEGLAASVALSTGAAVVVGSEIEVDDVVGEVLVINSRSTVVRTRDNRHVHIPNVDLLAKTVTVYDAEDERRSAVDVTVDLGTDLDHASRIIGGALGGLEVIRRVGSVRARFVAEGVQLSIRFWHAPGLQEGNDATDAAVRTLKAAFAQAEISVVASVEITIKGDTDTHVGLDANGNEG